MARITFVALRGALKAVAIALTAGLLTAGGSAKAARDPVTPTAVARTEVVVYEDPSSDICQIFRQRIVPAFRAARGTKVPMRFIDITTMVSDTPGLNGQITVVPTAVVMQDGREVGRIVGYWGPEAFARMIAATIGSDE